MVSLPLRSRARRNNDEVLGRRLSFGVTATDGIDGFLSIMSEVDERRIFGGDEIDRNGELVCDLEHSDCNVVKCCDCVLSKLPRCEYGDAGNEISKCSSSGSWSTVSTFKYGGLAVAVMLVLLLDAVGAADVDLPELLVSLLSRCLFLMLEQSDLKLKSSDLKLMILEFRLTDFFDLVASPPPPALPLGDKSIGSFSAQTTALITFDCCPPNASHVLFVKSKRSEFF